MYQRILMLVAVIATALVMSCGGDSGKKRTIETQTGGSAGNSIGGMSGGSTPTGGTNAGNAATGGSSTGGDTSGGTLPTGGSAGSSVGGQTNAGQSTNWTMNDPGTPGPLVDIGNGIAHVQGISATVRDGRTATLGSFPHTSCPPSRQHMPWQYAFVGLAFIAFFGFRRTNRTRAPWLIAMTTVALATITFGTQAAPGGSGGEGGVSACETYTSTQPTFDTSDGNTVLTFAMPTLPIFGSYAGDCDGRDSLLDPSKVYIANAGGIDLLYTFGSSDTVDFFGWSRIFGHKPTFTFGGNTFSVISGLTMKSAICGDNVYLITNGSDTVTQLNISTLNGTPSNGTAGSAGTSGTSTGGSTPTGTAGNGGENTFLATRETVSPGRVDYHVGFVGISGLLCGQNGSIIFSTSRTWTIESIASAGQYPASHTRLVEADPIRIIQLDPTTNELRSIANVSGGSRILTQGAITLPGEPPTSMYLPGIANVLTRAQDGSILLGDHLAGTVWKIANDGSSVMQILTTDRLFNGLVEAPNGILYLSLNPVASGNCSSITAPPIIASYHPSRGVVEDWKSLANEDYNAILPSLCLDSIFESVFASDGSRERIFVNAGHYNDLQADPINPVLIVGSSILGKTWAITVSTEQGSAGAAGTSGAAGMPSAGASGSPASAGASGQIGSSGTAPIAGSSGTAGTGN